MLTRTEIENDPCLQDYLQSQWLKKCTKRIYIYRIKGYCQYLNKTPTELIEESEEEQDVGVKRRKHKIKQYIFDYIEYSKGEDRSIHTIRNYIENIKGFYRYFDIDPPVTSRAFPIENINPIFETLPTRDHPRKAVINAGLRDRAILYLQYSSGRGASEVMNLTYHQFLDSIIEYIGLTSNNPPDISNIPKIKNQDTLISTWKVVRFKTGLPYITFSSTQSTRAIIDYLSSRLRLNKHIKSLDDPLFVNQYNKILKSNTFTRIYERLNHRAGLGRRNMKRNFLTSHMLRKLFATTLYEEGMEQMKVDWMLGHKINQTTSAYFKANPEKIKQEYIQVEHKLSLRIKEYE